MMDGDESQTAGRPRRKARTLRYDGEIRRKALHLLSLAVPTALLVLDRSVVLWILTPLAVLALVADWARTRYAGFRTFIERVFGNMMRPEEMPKIGDPVVLNGATWVLVSFVLVIALFPVPVAAAALCIALIGDAAAALVGRRWGTLKTGLGDKSIQGSAAFLVTGIAIGLLVPELSTVAVVIGVLFGTLVEALPVPANDNVVVPVAIAIAMTITLALQGVV